MYNTTLFIDGHPEARERELWPGIDSWILTIYIYIKTYEADRLLSNFNHATEPDIRHFHSYDLILRTEILIKTSISFTARAVYSVVYPTTYYYG